MRIHAISDIHIDYEANANWVSQVSHWDYNEDVLILAGDVTDSLRLLGECFQILASRFRSVVYVPGNHELWVIRDDPKRDSLQKFSEVRRVAQLNGVLMEPFAYDRIVIMPLFAWYDYSFGSPSEELRSTWMDYRACRWPNGYAERELAEYFDGLNETDISASTRNIITFSHFLPRIDVMPNAIPLRHRYLYPVLGTTRLETQLRRLKSTMHVYGHSHVNRRVAIDGVTYINNAFGYPQETWIRSKDFLCIYES